jgi:hypothetical protein
MDIVLQPACLTINFYLQLTSAYNLFEPSEKVADVGSQSEAKASSWNKATLNQFLVIKEQGGQQKLHKAGDLAFIQPLLSLGGHKLAG